MMSMKIVQFSRPPTPLVHLRPEFFHTLDPGCLISNENPPPLSMITNQLKENKIHDYYMLSGVSFRSAFVFRINLLVLSGFPFTFFHLAETSLSAFLWLVYTFVSAVIYKYHKMLFIYKYSQF